MPKTPTQILQKHKGNLVNKLSLLKRQEIEATKAVDVLRTEIAKQEAILQNYVDAINALKKEKTDA